MNTVRHSFGERLVGAARLNVDTYEEVEADSSATPQAALVVLLASASAALGNANADLNVIIGGALSTLTAWLIWSAITYAIGATLFKGIATWGELLRTIGFAMAPGLLSAAAAIPGLREPVMVGVRLWILVAVIIAIRQALDFEGTWRAVFTALIGFGVFLGIGVLLRSLLA